MTIQQQVTKVEWEKEYSAGKWSCLETSPLERARHAVIGMFVQQFSPGGEILDVGCGLGTTTDFLNSIQRSKYLGVDISETAIEEATILKKVNFLAVDFFKLPIDKKYDVIIFNEVLYYLEEEAAFRQALKLLRNDGYIIVSLYSQKKMHYSDSSIWKLSRQFFNPIENIEVRGNVGGGRVVTWRIEILGMNKISSGHSLSKDGNEKKINVNFGSFIKRIRNIF